MIDRHLILDCAERAGFGGAQRAQLFPKLALFAQFMLENQKQQYVEACNALGDAFEILKTEFADGQMDGAYQCAEKIKHADHSSITQPDRTTTELAPSTDSKSNPKCSEAKGAGSSQNAGSSGASQGTYAQTESRQKLPYFGWPADILDCLSDELGASAYMFHDDVRESMQYLSDRLYVLSPLFIALEKYCGTDTDDDYPVIDAYERLLKTQVIA